MSKILFNMKKKDVSNLLKVKNFLMILSCKNVPMFKLKFVIFRFRQKIINSYFNEREKKRGCLSFISEYKMK